MMSQPSTRVGVEIELTAPRGVSRADLAAALAGPGGRVRRFFHTQSEPSAVPGTPVFDNLTPGFTAVNAQGEIVAHCVDDLTLLDGLNRHAPARAGWHRIVSDDGRLLRLVARHCDPDASLETVLNPIAALFGTTVEVGEGQMHRVADQAGLPIAIAAPLPGERERPCELVTPPIDGDLEARLEALLAPARALGFAVPAEAAVHLHYDADVLRDALVVRSLVRFWEAWGETLKLLVAVNPRCRRLGRWPEALRATVEAPDFTTLDWPAARGRLAKLGLTKYCDLNLRNLVHDVPDKPTLEVRVLPGAIHAEPIVRAAQLFAAAHRRVRAQPLHRLGAWPAGRQSAERLLWSLPLEPSDRLYWLSRAATLTA